MVSLYSTTAISSSFSEETFVRLVCFRTNEQRAASLLALNEGRYSGYIGYADWVARQRRVGLDEVLYFRTLAAT